MAAKVRARRPTTTLIMSHLCLRAGNSIAGPTATLSQLNCENLEVAGIAPGATVEIHGRRNLNADGARVRAHHLSNSGSLSRRMQAQLHEDIPRSTALHMLVPQLLRQVGECQTQSPIPSEEVRLRKVRAEDPHPRLGKGEVKVARPKLTRGTVDLTNTIPRPQHGTRLIPLFR